MTLKFLTKNNFNLTQKMLRVYLNFNSIYRARIMAFRGS